MTLGINESWKSDGYKTSGFLGIRFSAKAESSVSTTWIKGGCSTNPSNKVCFNTNLSGAVTGGGSLTVQWPWWSWSGGATVTGSGGIGCEICGTFDDDGNFTMGSLKCKPKKFSVKGQVCVGVCIDFTIF